MDNNEFPLKDECYQIIGACMEVASENESSYNLCPFVSHLCAFVDKRIVAL